MSHTVERLQDRSLWNSGYFACPNNLLNSIIYDLAKLRIFASWSPDAIGKIGWTQKINVYTIDS